MGAKLCKVEKTITSAADIPMLREVQQVLDDVPCVQEDFHEDEHEEEVVLSAEGVGDHVCGVTGKQEAEAFTSQEVLKRLLERSGEELGRTFSLAPKALTNTQERSAGGIACAVSDPSGEDCPLVYVSSGFEDLTGYTTDFTTGRNCRFLQPISKIINDAFNLDDRKEMRAFCVEPQENGKTIVNLLLNENGVTGERFWNLLRMQYISVDDRQYIFGVQTTIDAYMPKALAKRLKKADSNRKVVETLTEFTAHLTRIRSELKKMLHAPIFEVKGYFTAMLNHVPVYTKMTRQMSSTPIMDRQVSPTPGDGESTHGDHGDDIVAEGVRVTLLADIKYASGTLHKGDVGTVKSIDTFGNAAIDFEGHEGTRGVLKRDLSKLTTRSKGGSKGK